MRSWKLLLALFTSTLCFAAQPDRVVGPIDSSQMVALPGHLHRYAQPQYDQGPVQASLQLKQLTLLTLPTPSQQKALNLLLAQQQDRTSPNFHKWLTPEQYADRFGLSLNDVQKISAWLKSQGLTVASVARGRNWIVFSGTAAQVENAFQTQLHHYNVNGEMHFANATMPSIPAALSGIAQGVRGLDDFHPKPMYVKKTLPQAKSARPDYYDSFFQIPDFLAPGDIETIYDLSPLYTNGIDGTGQKLVIVGQTDVYLADLNAFRTGFGLPLISGCTTSSSGVIIAPCNTSNFQYVLDGGDPGVHLGDLTEADLDLEWSAATARGAQIIFVNSSDVFTSYYYAIDNELAPVISMSYGAPCEFDDNFVETSSGQPGPDEVELMKSNSEGITFMNSSGDSGAASCDSPVNPDTTPQNLAVGGLAVSYPASSPEVTGVGGTAVAYPSGFSSTFWGTTLGANGGTAQNPPLPETSWNDDAELVAAYPGSFSSASSAQESYAIVSSGGGASNCAKQTSDNSDCVSGFAKPSWQTVTVSGQSTRMVPDVSLLASPNFPGYVYCTPVEELSSDPPYNSETTSSCGTGTASEIQASVSGIFSGNTPIVNPSLVGGTSASSPIFAGMVTLLNQYLAAVSPGGLGNINPTLYTLAKTTSSGAFHQVTTGSNVVYCQGGTPAQPWPTTMQCPGSSGVSSFGYQASSADSTTGYNLVTGLGSVDANNLAIAWKSFLSPDFALSAGGLAPTPIPAGQSATTTLTIGPVAGSSAMVVNFAPSSCAGLPTGATCSFNPASVTFDGTHDATTVLTISTLPNMAPSGPTTITITPTNSSSTTATVSLTVTATTESFTLASTANTYSVSVGGTVPVNLTVNSANGFITNNSTTALPLTYSCSGSPNLSTAEISCQFSPSNGQGVSLTAVTLNLVTTPATAQLRPPLGRGRGIFYALLLPGLFGIVFAAGSRTRGLRLLSLIVVLGFSTLWLGSCSSKGSNNNTPPNAGTPPGSYVVTISATTGGSVPLTNSNAPFTVTLTVTQ
jgi:subtilase family serine protease